MECVRGGAKVSSDAMDSVVNYQRDCVIRRLAIRTISKRNAMKSILTFLLGILLLIAGAALWGWMMNILHGERRK